MTRRPIHVVLVDPRTAMACLVALFAVTGWFTFRYPPGYLVLPHVWAILAIAAAILTGLSAVWQGRKHTAWAGGCVVFAAATRGIAIIVSAIGSPVDEPVQSSRWIAAITWLVVAMLAWLVWDRVVTPWVAASRVARGS